MTDHCVHILQRDFERFTTIEVNERSIISKNSFELWKNKMFMDLVVVSVSTCHSYIKEEEPTWGKPVTLGSRIYIKEDVKTCTPRLQFRDPCKVWTVKPELQNSSSKEKTVLLLNPTISSSTKDVTNKKCYKVNRDFL